LIVAVAPTVSGVSSEHPCGSAQRWLCTFVDRHSDNYALARAAHYLSPWITSLLIVVALLVVNAVVKRLIGHVVRRLEPPGPDSPTPRKAQRAATIGGALHSLASIVIVIVGIFAILTAFGVNIAPLLAGAGLAGVIIGFGAQNLMRDVIAGTMMIFEDQFGVGDEIDTGVATGVVEAITLRVTRLRDTDGVTWYVPNGSMPRVANLSQRSN
jgi:small-conductance mechanosensitive channel